MEYWIHWLTLHEIRTSPELRNGVVSRQQHVLSCPEHCPSGQRRHRRPLLRWIQRIQEVRIAQRGQLAERSGLDDIQRLRDTIPGEICQLEHWMGLNGSKGRLTEATVPPLAPPLPPKTLKRTSSTEGKPRSKRCSTIIWVPRSDGMQS